MELKERILIIEDERPMRTVLKDALERQGYRPLTAADGEAGLEMAIRERPDLIVLDVMMPKIDGFALCAELRKLGHMTPVLMLTAKGQVEEKVWIEPGEKAIWNVRAKFLPKKVKVDPLGWIRTAPLWNAKGQHWDTRPEKKVRIKPTDS